MTDNLPIHGREEGFMVLDTSFEGSVVDQILACHRMGESHGLAAINWFLRCGRLLCEQKEQLDHGEWLPWLSRNVPEISERTVNRYMRWYQNRDVIEANAPKMAETTHAAVDKLVSKPKTREQLPSMQEMRDWLRGSGEFDEEQSAPKQERMAAAEWSEQQKQKLSRASDLLHEALRSSGEARGLWGFGAGEELRRASIHARQAASLLDDLAGSF